MKRNLIVLSSCFLLVQNTYAQTVTYELNAGLLPVEKATINGASVSDLFSAPISIVPQQPSQSQKPSTNTGLPNTPVLPSSSPSGSSSSSGNRAFKQSGITDPDFRCDLFSNNDYAAILSAVTTLNQAVNACSGTEGIDASAISKSGKTITDSVGVIKPILESSEAMTEAQGTQLVTSVDSAIKAASSIATTFANSDTFKKGCNGKVSSGDVALAVNSLINGLTPYAISAASLVGGTAAIPFLVGGSAITSIVDSLNKIIDQNTVDIKDSQVRRAILENTCQFIKIDQKYKYLLKDRGEQVSKINSEIKQGQVRLQDLYSSLSSETKTVLSQQQSANQRLTKIRTSVAAAQTEFSLDKDFGTSTTDSLKICQLGLQLTKSSADSSSYINRILQNLDSSALEYGNQNLNQVLTLKNSAQIALSSLSQMSMTPTAGDFNYTSCTTLTKSLIDTLDTSITVSNKLLDSAQTRYDQVLVKYADYSDLKKQQDILVKKQKLASHLTGSLDNLRSYANSFTQSEIDSELAKIRLGLFANGTFGTSSPVKSWFEYTESLHQSTLQQFYNGIRSLQTRAFKLTKSGSQAGYAATSKQDQVLRENIATLTFDYIAKGSKAQTDACRELGDVFNQYQTAVNHLAAYESLCAMVDNYVFDNRSEDQPIIRACRGTTAVLGAGNNASKLTTLKNKLVSDKAVEWAKLIQKRLVNLECE